MKEKFFIRLLVLFFYQLFFFFLDILLFSSIYFTEVKTRDGIWEREKRKIQVRLNPKLCGSVFKKYCYCIFVALRHQDEQMSSKCFGVLLCRKQLNRHDKSIEQIVTIVMWLGVLLLIKCSSNLRKALQHSELLMRCTTTISQVYTLKFHCPNICIFPCKRIQKNKNFDGYQM